MTIKTSCFIAVCLSHAILGLEQNPDVANPPADTTSEPLLLKLIRAELMDVENLGSPPSLAWATPRSDDRERVHDRRLPFDQPNLARAIMASPPYMQARVERSAAAMIKSLPKFPDFLTGVDAPKKWVPKAPSVDGV